MKLTKEQLEVVKGLVEQAGNMADQILTVMKNHGLDKVEGCNLTITVDPKCLFTTEFIQFGDVGTDVGIIRLAKGRRCNSEKFVPFGKNSAEYELLFADESVRSRIQAIIDAEKPLPPDGMWLGDWNSNNPVDSGWDVNESTS